MKESTAWVCIVAIVMIALTASEVATKMARVQMQPKPAIVILQVPAVWTEARRVEFMRCVDSLDRDAKDLEKQIVDCAGVSP